MTEMTTDKATCRMLIDLLPRYGVRHAIVSPGSRNTPLIVAAAREKRLLTKVIIDERCAAFAALGMADATAEPVALICTSGTAMLNYAPAVAEAFYRQVPLIVITADRPYEWIDQDDSQTIRQPGALSNVVKQTLNIPVETGDDTQRWMINRRLNDILATAMADTPGPVHINVQLDDPLGGASSALTAQRVISVIQPSRQVCDEWVEKICAEIARSQRLLIVVGFHTPSRRLNEALDALAKLPQVAVLHEAQSNLHRANLHGHIDRLMRLGYDRLPRPDMVITMGGSLLSRMVKQWLRSVDGVRHWHIGVRGQAVDCFKHMECRVEYHADAVMAAIAPRIAAIAGADYAELWRALEAEAEAHFRDFAAKSPWSDFTAMRSLVEQIPAAYDLQVSNGTAIRYLQLCDYSAIGGSISCNRGVSGIDGCTSTAIGAAMATGRPTLLITGDMSAQYDLGALAIADIPSTFRMAVLNNDGGGIFRFVRSTASLPEREEYFAARVNLPLRQLAEGFGFDYFEATSETELRQAVSEFFDTERQRPAILNIITPAEVSARRLNSYFNQ